MDCNRIYQIVDSDDNVLEDNLSLSEAEDRLSRYLCEDADAYISHPEWTETV